MFLQVGKNYMLVFDANGKVLTYTAVVLEFDNNFVKFKDKYGETFTYKISMLNSAREIEA